MTGRSPPRRVEIVIDADVRTGRGVVEVSEPTGGGTAVRTARFTAA